MLSSKALAMPSQALPLPPGWFWTFDQHGRTFYYNTKGESRWEHPSQHLANAVAAATAAAVAHQQPVLIKPQVVTTTVAQIMSAPEPQQQQHKQQRAPVVEKEIAKTFEGDDDDDDDDNFVDDDTMCSKCLQGEKPETIVLCDMCDRGFHTLCHEPPVVQELEELSSWYCYECAPVHNLRVHDDAMRRERKTTKQGKRKEEEDDDEPCAKCGESEVGETLVLCDYCSQPYHAACVKLSELPGEDDMWFCPSCDGDAGKPAKASQPGMRSQRRRPARAQSDGDDDSESFAVNESDEDYSRRSKSQESRRKRGRPRKAPPLGQHAPSSLLGHKRQRGRPKKHSLPTEQHGATGKVQPAESIATTIHEWADGTNLKS